MTSETLLSPCFSHFVIPVVKMLGDIRTLRVSSSVWPGITDKFTATAITPSLNKKNLGKKQCAFCLLYVEAAAASL
jgi:hypothetical protein